MIKSVKRLGAAVLSAVMMLTAVATPLGDNLPAVRESTSLTASAASWPSDYRNWSQAASDNSMMRSYGCWVVAQAKLLQEIGATPSGFNPDSYLNWEKSNGYINSNFNQVNGVNAPCKYAQQQGKSLSYLGAISSNITSKIWDNINNGYYSIIYVKTSAGSSHYVMIGNALSKSNNAIWVYNSNTAQSSAKPTSLSSKNYTLKELYTYKSGSTPSTDNVKLPGISSKKSNTVSDTNAFVVTDVYKPSNYKLTKAGIRIRREDDTYDNGWSEFHNTASTWTGYDYMYISYDMNSEVKITLRHGTKYYYKFYAVIEGKEYWSPEQSFTTTGSHSYGSWYTKTSATCTSGGTEERKCSCGATESRSTSALGHNYGSTYFEAAHPHKYAHLCQRCGYKEFTGGNLAIYEKCDICYNENLPGKPSLNISSNGFKETDNVSFTWNDTEKTTHYVLTVAVLSGDEYKTVCRETYVNSGFETTFGKGQYRALLQSYNSNMFHQYTSDWKDWVHNNSDYVYFDIECAHEYSKNVIKPTFESEGYTLYTCTKCGYSYKGDYIAKLTKPNPVSGLTYYNRSADTISVKWGKVSNADGYILEWLNGNKFEKAASFTANDDLKYTFENLSPATMYKFRVRCYKVSGGTRYYSDYSTVLNVKTYPQKISEVKQTAATESSVTVWWDKTESARGYVIEKLNGDTWERVITLKDGLLNTYTVTGLNPSTEYQFRIKRYITDGEKMLFGAYSEVYTATTSPKTPVNFAVSAKSSTYFTFKWDKDEKADGYEIQQYTNGEWTAVAKTYGNTYTVKNLKAGTAGYKFRLRAYIEGKNLDAYSNCSSVLTLNTNPYGVGGFKCSSKTSTSVTLKWNKGTTASGYQLQQYKDGKWVTIYTGTKATNTSFTVKGLKAGTAGYRFRIRAYKTYGSSKQYGSWSSEVKVNTNPYGVSGFKCSSKTSTSVTLKWNKGTTASGYQLQQYKDGKWVTIYTGTKATNTSFTVKGLKAGTAGYKFRIRAYKTYGSTKQYGSWSNELVVNTNPYGVGGFKTKTVTSTNVTLQWNKGTTAEGYQLQQYKGGNWVTIFTADKAATTTYTVKSLKADTSYKFRIRAYKTYGNTKQCGSWSSTLTVKTKK